MLPFKNNKMKQNIILFIILLIFKETHCYNMERLLQNRRIRSFQRSYQNDNNKILIPITRNSLIRISKQELKLIGGVSKNCFFTPIQCMIQHDMNKLSRMLDQTNKY
uniref:Uncharacterized protein n=3 Tax=Meloidogyne TaxID=189290 RepID=A0A6V7Y053_MELEN|nr:unnamed protein product [Meloidogyne enterolobii]